MNCNWIPAGPRQAAGWNQSNIHPDQKLVSFPLQVGKKEKQGAAWGSFRSPICDYRKFFASQKTQTASTAEAREGSGSDQAKESHCLRYKSGKFVPPRTLSKPQIVNVADKDSKEKLWHRRYGHLGEQNLQGKSWWSSSTMMRLSWFLWNLYWCETPSQCFHRQHYSDDWSSGACMCGKIQEKSLGEKLNASSPLQTTKQDT